MPAGLPVMASSSTNGAPAASPSRRAKVVLPDTELPITATRINGPFRCGHQGQQVVHQVSGSAAPLPSRLRCPLRGGRRRPMGERQDEGGHPLRIAGGRRGRPPGRDATCRRRRRGRPTPLGELGIAPGPGPEHQLEPLGIAQGPADIGLGPPLQSLAGPFGGPHFTRCGGRVRALRCPPAGLLVGEVLVGGVCDTPAAWPTARAG